MPKCDDCKYYGDGCFMNIEPIISKKDGSEYCKYSKKELKAKAEKQQQSIEKGIDDFIENESGGIE